MDAVAVITPAVGDAIPAAEVNTTALGVLRFVWLKTLKNSARSCRFRCSVNAVSFLSEASTLDSPGPFNVSRLRLPYVPGVGRMNALGSKYFCAPPRITLPLKSGLTEGRIGFLVSPLFVRVESKLRSKGKAALCADNAAHHPTGNKELRSVTHLGEVEFRDQTEAPTSH